MVLLTIYCCFSKNPLICESESVLNAVFIALCGHLMWQGYQFKEHNISQQLKISVILPFKWNENVKKCIKNISQLRLHNNQWYIPVFYSFMQSFSNLISGTWIVYKNFILISSLTITARPNFRLVFHNYYFCNCILVSLLEKVTVINFSFVMISLLVWV